MKYVVDCKADLIWRCLKIASLYLDRTPLGIFKKPNTRAAENSSNQ